MAALTASYNLDNADRIQLGGDQWLVTGELTLDLGDYATGGLTVAASSLNADTIVRLIVGKPSVIKQSAYWIKSTGRIKLFLQDVISGIEAEQGNATAPGAQSIPFIAVVRKAA